jgi:acetyltransferase-like isoleucine patch superfamily enzyme
MASAIAIVVPLENVNDSNMLLAAWLVKDGEEVREGQTIAELETSKAIVEFPSPASGRITLLARAGDQIEVGAVIGHIGLKGEVAEPIADASLTGIAVSTRVAAPSHNGSHSLKNGARFSNKALQLMERHGVSRTAFPGRIMVREQDVMDLLKSAPPSEFGNAEIPFELRGIPLTGVTIPAELFETQKGILDPDFFAHLSRSAEAFGKLSSARKCREYARHGAWIGADVSIGEGTSIVAPRIVLGDGVKIGAHGDILCRESFSMGTLGSFRAGLTVRGGTVVLGQNVYAGSGIRIGGGGHADPWSLLCVGDNTFLGDDLFINICRPVVIGKEVFLTQRAMLVTHNVGHSVLEGYENCFEPIVLEDACQVGMGSTVYAGVRIGRSAIVASNSYVISSIPEGKLAMGVPARVVRDSARPIDRSAQLRIASTMVRDFRDLLKVKGMDVSEVTEDSFSLARDGQRYELRFVEAYAVSHSGNDPECSHVLWVLEAGEKAPEGATIFNLLEKTVDGATNIFTESAREFLRKRGIRFQPGPWRYRRGLI